MRWVCQVHRQKNNNWDKVFLLTLRAKQKFLKIKLGRQFKTVVKEAQL